MGVKIKNYKQTIMAIEFSSFRELRNAFVRMQEHAEHPHFRNRIFSHREYFDWCMANTGQKSLASDWLGIALEKKHIEPFIAGKFGRLSKDERRIVSAVLNAKLKKASSIIGYVKGRKADLKHELAHSFYFQSKAYRSKLSYILKTTLSKASWSALEQMLIHLDYAERRHKDEAHAYILDGLTEMKKLDPRLRKLPLKNRLEIKAAKKKFEKLFKEEAKRYGI